MSQKSLFQRRRHFLRVLLVLGAVPVFMPHSGFIDYCAADTFIHQPQKKAQAAEPSQVNEPVAQPATQPVANTSTNVLEFGNGSLQLEGSGETTVPSLPIVQNNQSVDTSKPRSTLQWQPKGTSAAGTPNGKTNVTATTRSAGPISSVAVSSSPAAAREIEAPRAQAPAAKYVETVDDPKKTQATLVSSRILNDPNFKRDAQHQTSVRPIDQSPGWQAVGERLSEHIRHCEALLRRGAFFSAHEEAELATMHLLRHIDLSANRFDSEPAWQAAHATLREAEDFAVAQRLSTDRALLRRLIDSHETPILKNANLENVSPLTAAQHYQLFAEKKLTYAAQGHPWVSELYFTLGRAYQAQAEAQAKAKLERVDALRNRALCFFRSAIAILPSNAVAYNQLGYLLLQMDRPAEARDALAASVSNGGPAEALQNLAEASRRIGDTTTQQWSLQTLANRQRTGYQHPATSPLPTGEVLVVDQRDFATLSPYSAGPHLSNNAPQMEAARSYTASPVMQSNLR